MQRCLGVKLTESALVYFNDVIVFARTFSQHLDHIPGPGTLRPQTPPGEMPPFPETGEVFGTCGWQSRSLT